MCFRWATGMAFMHWVILLRSCFLGICCPCLLILQTHHCLTIRQHSRTAKTWLRYCRIGYSYSCAILKASYSNREERQSVFHNKILNTRSHFSRRTPGIALKFWTSWISSEGLWNEIRDMFKVEYENNLPQTKKQKEISWMSEQIVEIYKKNQNQERQKFQKETLQRILYCC